MEGPMALIREVALMATIPVLFISQTILPSILACMNSTQFWVTFLCFVLPSYMLIVRHFRYQRVNMIKKQHGFTDDLKSYKAMTPDQSQAVLKNIAEWESPFLFEFGWISQFFKTATAPCLSKVIVNSGHFTNTDVLISHGRQQHTVSLMTQMQVQPLHSRENALSIARINEHHSLYAGQINSDTVLWLSWMWMAGPVQWINLIGWRKLQNFEVHAMFIYWREMSVMLGCKWVPNTLIELEDFRQTFEAKEQRFSHFNIMFSDSIMDAILFSIPGFLKSATRYCIVAVLDEDRYFCLPRMSPRVLTATTNANGTINFPEYTFPSTPYYVKQTLWNQYGPFAIVNRLRGLPIPAPRFGSNGVTWESVGAKQADNNRQLIAETRVLLKYSELMNNAWGFRPNINWQYKSIAVNRLMGRGYGSPLNAYQPDALVRL
ncbi:MAG: hypothetical protein ASARMPREDX12_006932 [Alectoria sarmentosa]|nr:MAG: hypothetical protein ASARMPREDX12_006932 [Alectoria sarmentosa]